MFLLKIQRNLCHPKSFGTFEKRAAGPICLFTLVVRDRDEFGTVEDINSSGGEFELWTRVSKSGVQSSSLVDFVSFSYMMLSLLRLFQTEIGIDARHIVDGHREKTLALLWQIIFHFQVI